MTSRSQITMQSYRPDQGLQALNSVSHTARQVYDTIVRRFLSIFYPPAVYQKVSITTKIKEESFFSNFKVLAEEGYLKVVGTGNAGKQDSESDMDMNFFELLQTVKKMERCYR